jgi:hypothetical protein
MSVPDRYDGAGAEPDLVEAVIERVEELAGVEWRVQWRRAAWSRTTGTPSRRFARVQDLDAFLARLNSGDRPDLSPLTLLRVTWRHVGEWQDRGWAGDRLLDRCGRPRADGQPCRARVTEQGDACRLHAGPVR